VPLRLNPAFSTFGWGIAALGPGGEYDLLRMARIIAEQSVDMKEAFSITSEQARGATMDL
jgi:hypothetical protein